jgi:hypothetical protein
MKDPTAVFESYVNDLRNNEIADYIKLNIFPSAISSLKNSLKVFIARLNKIKSIIENNQEFKNSANFF